MVIALVTSQFLADAPTDGSTVLMPVLASHLGITPKNPRFSYAVQAFETSHGKKLLVLNKRNRKQEVTLPAEADGGRIDLVALSTGDKAPATEKLSGRVLTLQPFEVAVITYR